MTQPEQDKPVPVCWECEQPLTTDEDRERGAHVECIRAHMDYVERWGNEDDDG